MDSASDNIVPLENNDSKCDGTLGDSVVEDTGSTFDFDFSEKTWKEDLTLIVEGKTLFVNKSILAVASPVFCRMFESDFKEKSQDKIELPEKKHADVLEFLRCFYPNIMKRVTDKTFMQVLPLADEYQMEGLKTNCETSLLSIVNNDTADDDLLKYLTQACLYRLEELKQKCIVFLAQKDLNELEEVNERMNSFVPWEASHELLSIINGKQRSALKEAKSLKELYERKQQIHNYIRAGCNKSDNMIIRQFDDAHGACTTMSFDPKPNVDWFSSSPVGCKGLQWVVRIGNMFPYHNMTAGLQCQSILCAPCQVTIKIVLINTFMSRENVCKTIEYTFTNKSKEKVVEIISTEELRNDTAGFMVDGTATLDVYFLVK